MIVNKTLKTNFENCIYQNAFLKCNTFAAVKIVFDKNDVFSYKKSYIKITANKKHKKSFPIHWNVNAPDIITRHLFDKFNKKKKIFNRKY